MSVSANAQEKTELDVFKHTAIDTTQLIVSYDLIVKYDLSGQNNPDFEKVYTYIGRKVCQSFVESEHNADLRMAKAFLRNGKRGSRASMKLVANVGETYIGYPKGKDNSYLQYGRGWLLPLSRDYSKDAMEAYNPSIKCF